MSRKKNRPSNQPAKDDANPRQESAVKDSQQAAQQSTTDAPEGSAPDVEVAGWVDRKVRPQRRNFAASGRIDEPLRIAFTADAHAEIVAHAKEALDTELCGVLIGTICEDDQGLWVSAEVALRGETSKQGGTHVTYTHETWEKIYQEKDEKYPRLSILGWYHTHPGFGVQFSEMDLFIQRNFFPGETQFALVIDPLSGDEAVIANTDDGTRYAGCFWVDGQQRKALVPRDEATTQDKHAATGESVSVELDDRLREVEDRLAQVLHATETQREAHYRIFLTLVLFVGLLSAGVIAYMVNRSFERKNVVNPKLGEVIAVPMQVGDKLVHVAMQPIQIEIPDPENVVKKIRQEAEREAALQAAETIRAVLAGTEQEEPAAKAYNWYFLWACMATALFMISVVFHLQARRPPRSSRT